MTATRFLEVFAYRGFRLCLSEGMLAFRGPITNLDDKV